MLESITADLCLGHPYAQIPAGAHAAGQPRPAGRDPPAPREPQDHDRIGPGPVEDPAAFDRPGPGPGPLASYTRKRSPLWTRPGPGRCGTCTASSSESAGHGPPRAAGQPQCPPPVRVTAAPGSCRSAGGSPNPLYSEPVGSARLRPRQSRRRAPRRAHARRPCWVTRSGTARRATSPRPIPPNRVLEREARAPQSWAARLARARPPP